MDPEIAIENFLKTAVRKEKGFMGENEYFGDKIKDFFIRLLLYREMFGNEAPIGPNTKRLLDISWLLVIGNIGIQTSTFRRCQLCFFF